MCAVNQLCLEGHSNFFLIIQSAFNYFTKNELKCLNALNLKTLDQWFKKSKNLPDNMHKSKIY